MCPTIWVHKWATETYRERKSLMTKIFGHQSRRPTYGISVEKEISVSDVNLVLMSESAA